MPSSVRISIIARQDKLVDMIEQNRTANWIQKLFQKSHSFGQRMIPHVILASNENEWKFICGFWALFNCCGTVAPRGKFFHID